MGNEMVRPIRNLNSVPLPLPCANSVMSSPFVVSLAVSPPPLIWQGYGITITTADIMGKACIYGGAEVTGQCVNSNEKVVSNVTDNGDGSYYLHWNSNHSGTISVAIKIG